MKILLIAATSYELTGIIQFLETNGTKKNFFEYTFGDHSYFPLVTGIGAMMTAFSISRYCTSQTFDIAFNIGVAGSIQQTFELGDVVQVIEDRFADLGVEESDGSFTDLFELGLADGNNFPFTNNVIPNQSIPFSSIPEARAITVNTSHGSEKSIEQIKSKFKFEIESMEGAAFFYASKILDMPCYQIRSISNYIESRNKENWRIDLALDNLRDKMIPIFQSGFVDFPKKKGSFS